MLLLEYPAILIFKWGLGSLESLNKESLMKMGMCTTLVFTPVHEAEGTNLFWG